MKACGVCEPSNPRSFQGNWSPAAQELLKLAAQPGACRPKTYRKKSISHGCEQPQVAPLVLQALVANYAGDEDAPSEIDAMIDYLRNQDELMKALGNTPPGICADLGPSDHTLEAPVGQ